MSELLTEDEVLKALESISHEVQRLPPGWLKFARAIEKKVMAKQKDTIDALQWRIDRLESQNAKQSQQLTDYSWQTNPDRMGS